MCRGVTVQGSPRVQGCVCVSVQEIRRCSRCPQVYKQKVKHLLYEHQNNLTEMKAEGTVVMKLAQKGHRTQEGALRKDVRALRVELKEQELANEVVVKNLRLVGVRARRLTGRWGPRTPDDSAELGIQIFVRSSVHFGNYLKQANKQACSQTHSIWEPGTELCLRLSHRLTSHEGNPAQRPLPCAAEP